MGVTDNQMYNNYRSNNNNNESYDDKYNMNQQLNSYYRNNINQYP